MVAREGLCKSLRGYLDRHIFGIAPVFRAHGDDVDFDYRGMNQALVDIVTVPDVIWACEQLAKIPDGHWQAAFRAGAYSQDVADRYIRKIKQKIAEGLALRTSTTH